MSRTVSLGPTPQCSTSRELCWNRGSEPGMEEGERGRPRGLGPATPAQGRGDSPQRGHGPGQRRPGPSVAPRCSGEGGGGMGGGRAGHMQARFPLPFASASRTFKATCPPPQCSAHRRTSDGHWRASGPARNTVDRHWPRAPQRRTNVVHTRGKAQHTRAATPAVCKSCTTGRARGLRQPCDAKNS